MAAAACRCGQHNAGSLLLHSIIIASTDTLEKMVPRRNHLTRDHTRNLRLNSVPRRDARLRHLLGLEADLVVRDDLRDRVALDGVDLI